MLSDVRHGSGRDVPAGFVVERALEREVLSWTSVAEWGPVRSGLGILGVAAMTLGWAVSSTASAPGQVALWVFLLGVLGLWLLHRSRSTVASELCLDASGLTLVQDGVSHGVDWARLGDVEQAGPGQVVLHGLRVQPVSVPSAAWLVAKIDAARPGRDLVVGEIDPAILKLRESSPASD